MQVRILPGRPYQWSVNSCTLVSKTKRPGAIPGAGAIFDCLLLLLKALLLSYEKTYSQIPESNCKGCSSFAESYCSG